MFTPNLVVTEQEFVDTIWTSILQCHRQLAAWLLEEGLLAKYIPYLADHLEDGDVVKHLTEHVIPPEPGTCPIDLCSEGPLYDAVFDWEIEAPDPKMVLNAVQVEIQLFCTFIYDSAVQREFGPAASALLRDSVGTAYRRYGKWSEAGTKFLRALMELRFRQYANTLKQEDLSNADVFTKGMHDLGAAASRNILGPKAQEDIIVITKLVTHFVAALRAFADIGKKVQIAFSPKV